MMNNISSDFFTTPLNLTLNELSFCVTTVKGLENWLDALPPIQLGDTAKFLFNAIEEIANLNCKEILRFEFIQTLHISLEQVLNILEKDLSQNTSFSSGNNQNVIFLAQEFRCYISKIYSHIALSIHQELNNTQFSLFSFRQKKRLLIIRTLSTYFSLEQLSLLKYQQLILYKNALVGQWKIAHQMYSVAHENGFENDKIDCSIPIKDDIDSIKKIYKQINLLDLLHTHQIRPIEIHALYQCSFQWIHVIHLNQQENLLSRYFIDTKKDYPPVLNSLHLNKSSSDFFIETQGLLEHINLINLPQHQSLSKVEKNFLSPSLIFHVQNLLNNAPERRYERYNFNSTIQLTFGLQSAHYYLSHTQDFNDTLKLDTTIDLHSDSKMLSTWNSEIKNNNIQQKYVRLDQESKHIYTCEVLDISVNGYRIRWKNQIPKQLKTGEFLLIQENPQSPWRSGTIRWLKQMPDKNIEFGVEVLSQEITPCALQLSGNRGSKNYHPVLLIKNTVLNEVNLSLVVPGSQMCKEHQHVFLRINQKQIKIYFTKVKLINQSFTHLDFEFLNDEEQKFVDHFIHQHAETIKKQDLWESLK